MPFLKKEKKKIFYRWKLKSCYLSFGLVVFNSASADGKSFVVQWFTETFVVKNRHLTL